MKLSTIVAFALSLSGVACSSSSSSPATSGDGGADSGGGDPATACADLASAYCAKFESCGKIPFELAFGDAAGCSARSTASCVAGLGANGTSATAASTEACSKAVT